MLLEQLYAHFKKWTEIGRQLNLGMNTYQNWRKLGYIPYRTQVVIERKTNGLFKAYKCHAKPQVKK